MGQVPRIDPVDAPMFAGLSEEKLDEAVENVTRYLRVVIQIADRLDHDPELRARYHALTEQHWTGRVRHMGDSPNDSR